MHKERHPSETPECLISGFDRKPNLANWILSKQRRLGNITRPSNAVITRSKKKIYKTVVVNFHKEYDKDIISKLDEVPSKQGYIKESIREKISRENE